jgi:hypothetical protein
MPAWVRLSAGLLAQRAAFSTENTRNLRNRRMSKEWQTDVEASSRSLPGETSLRASPCTGMTDGSGAWVICPAIRLPRVK